MRLLSAAKCTGYMWIFRKFSFSGSLYFLTFFFFQVGLSNAFKMFISDRPYKEEDRAKRVHRQTHNDRLSENGSCLLCNVVRFAMFPTAPLWSPWEHICLQVGYYRNLLFYPLCIAYSISFGKSVYPSENQTSVFFSCFNIALYWPLHFGPSE